MQLIDSLPIHVSGHVTIIDNATKEVVVDKANAIHPKNMATAIARGLSNAANQQIFKIKFGNRGTYIDSTQQIVFNPPITSGDTADLYNATYVEVVDDSSTEVGTGNSVTYTNIAGSTNTRVIVTCVISSNEAFDNALDTVNAGQIEAGTASPYFFDELGLFTKQTSGLSTDMDPSGELMLSHLVFSPLEKTQNREFTVIYVLTVSVS